PQPPTRSGRAVVRARPSAVFAAFAPVWIAWAPGHQLILSAHSVQQDSRGGENATFSVHPVDAGSKSAPRTRIAHELRPNGLSSAPPAAPGSGPASLQLANVLIGR